MKYKSLAAYWANLAEAHSIPQNERDKIYGTGCTSVYGEITEKGIIRLMDEIPFRRGKFVDLGSGRGNVVAFVAYNYNFDRCYGVEMSEKRHRMAEKILLDVSANVKGMDKVSLECGDLFDFDLSDMDVVFCDNLVFNEEGINRLFEKACKEMKEGSFMVSMKLAPSRFAPLQRVTRITVLTSWSEQCPIFVYRIIR